MRECRRWMPGLDLWPEDYGNFGGVFGFNERVDGGMQRAEHLGRKGTYVV